MRKINRIIVHCSATPDDQDVSSYTIDRWHRDRGWSEIGYHWVIRRDGTLEKGRTEPKIGAHTKGHNHDSIGICWVGTEYLGYKQYFTMINLLGELLDRYSLDVSNIHGHYEFTTQKTCPNLDMDEIREHMEQFLEHAD